MTIIMYPRFKLEKHPKLDKHFVMDDMLHNGTKFILRRDDLEELLGHIELVLGKERKDG